MKITSSTVFAVVAAGCLSFGGVAFGQGRSGQAPGRTNNYGPMNNPGLEHMSDQGLESSDFGRTRAEAARTKHLNKTPKPGATPRGHHYGWEKGKHNPHHGM